MVVVLVAVTMIIVSLVMIWLFRYKIFVFTSGFGTYTTPATGPCLSSTTFCADPGLQLVTQSCVSNPDTGWGCLVPPSSSLLGSPPDMSFADRVSTSPCLPTCRLAVWQNDGVTPCAYPASLFSNGVLPACLPAGTQGTHRLTSTCVANDSTGPNTCTIEINPYDPLPAPAGCQLSDTRYTCPIGTRYERDAACPVLAPQPVCGTWALDPPCVSGGSAVPSATCFSVDGSPLPAPTDIFTVGFTVLPFTCVSSSDEETSPVCLSYPGCTDTFPLSVGDATVVCNGSPFSLESADNTPGCVQPCLYYPQPLVPPSNVPATLTYLYGGFFFITRGSLILTLQNTPGTVLPSQEYRPNVLSSAYPYFADPIAKPGAALLDTPVVWADRSDMLARPALYSLPTTCTLDEITRMTGLLITFVPSNQTVGTTPPPSVPGYYRATTRVLFNKQSYGTLTGGAPLTWSPLSTTLSGATENTSPIVVGVDVDRVDLVGPNETRSPLSVPVMTPVGLESAVSLETVTFIPAPGIAAFTSLLNARTTRWNPSSCNPFYTVFPPPRGYPYPDVGTE